MEISQLLLCGVLEQDKPLLLFHLQKIELSRFGKRYYNSGYKVKAPVNLRDGRARNDTGNSGKAGLRRTALAHEGLLYARSRYDELGNELVGYVMTCDVGESYVCSVTRLFTDVGLEYIIAIRGRVQGVHWNVAPIGESR